MALYAIGFNEHDLVKININTYMTSDDKIYEEISLIEYNLPTHRITFYNNLEDAVKVLLKIKSNKTKVKVSNALLFLCNDKVNLDDLNIYEFTSQLVSEDRYKRN